MEPHSKKLQKSGRSKSKESLQVPKQASQRALIPITVDNCVCLLPSNLTTFCMKLRTTIKTLCNTHKEHQILQLEKLMLVGGVKILFAQHHRANDKSRTSGSIHLVSIPLNILNKNLKNNLLDRMSHTF